MIGLTIAGCGGGGHHKSKAQKMGVARLLVDWPSGRATASDFTSKIRNLRISIWSGSKMMLSEDLVKPNQAAPFGNLPPGQYKMDIRARETDDDSAPIVAGVGIPLTIVAAQTVDVHFSLTTAVDRVEISPGTLTLEALASGDLTLTAYDASGAVTLGNPNTLEIRSSAPSVATSDFTGAVTAGAGGGTTTLWFTDTSVNRSGMAIINVLPPPSLSLAPSRVVLAKGQSQLFSPALIGLLDTAVRWSVTEGGVGGSIDQNGRYTAPKKDGLFHVVATSTSRPTLTATATVVVGSGSTNVSVH